MSTVNASPAAPSKNAPVWKRGLGALSMACAGAFTVVLVQVFLSPQPDFVSGLLGPAIKSANAIEAEPSSALAEVRRHRQSETLSAQHGTYVRDPYGCLYMFQYVGAKLTLTQVHDDRSEPICVR